VVLSDIHRRWGVDGDPLRSIEEQNPQRTPTEKAEIDLAAATALVSIAESLASLASAEREQRDQSRRWSR
jgi:hypothetical protein